MWDNDTSWQFGYDDCMSGGPYNPEGCDPNEYDKGWDEAEIDKEEDYI